MKKLNELTIIEAIEGLKNADFNSVDIVKACYEQIKKYDDSIKAYITLTEEYALSKAKNADEELKKKGIKAFEEKPLLGIPYACKDNFSTKGIETTAGSNVLKGYIPPFESTVTKRLNDAGAVLLGKTNMDAFAHGSSTENSDFFDTKNPWDYKKVPGGSSGGSAAAVSADMCIFATGSETAGSIRGPASWCGVTGLKPSYGRVSRYGVVAMASSTDSPGPITKSVEDSALVLGVIAGKDPYDATSSTSNVPNYYENIKELAIRGIKIGKPRSYFDLDLEYGVRQRVEELIDAYENMGAEIVDIDLLSPKYSIAVYTILQRSEVSSNLARLDGIRYGNDRSNFGFEAKKRIMLGAYSLSAGYYDAYYIKAQKVRTLIINDFNEAFKKVDVLIAPSMPCVALNLGENEKSSMFGELMDVLTEPSSIAGICGISIPAGIADDMPVGAMFMGPVGSENLIIGIANKFQEVTQLHRERPVLL